MAQFGKILRRKRRANFRKVSDENNSDCCCRSCEYHKLKYLNPSDPYNSDVEHYCEYHSFRFEENVDLYTCDKYYFDDSLLRELAAIIKSQNNYD